MRKLKLTAILSFAILVGQAQSKNLIDQPYLEVTGSADTLVTPNEIFTRILISEKDTKDKTSLEELEAKMFAAFKSLGIDVEKNLTTNDMMSNYRSFLFKSKGEEFEQIGNPAFLRTTGNIYTDQSADRLLNQALRSTPSTDKKPWWRIW